MMGTIDEILEQVVRERDEIRALKVPPSVDELLEARMDKAVAEAERDRLRGLLQDAADHAQDAKDALAGSYYTRANLALDAIVALAEGGGQ